jgi:hypothetical protein
MHTGHPWVCRGTAAAPCAPPEIHPFWFQKHLLGVRTLRRCFFEGSPRPAPGFRAFSAQNLAQTAPNIEPKTPSESQKKPSAFGAHFRRNSADSSSRMRQKKIADFVQRTVFGLAHPHLLGLPQFQRLSAARARCLSSCAAPRLTKRHLRAPRRAGRLRKTRFYALFRACFGAAAAGNSARGFRGQQDGGRAAHRSDGCRIDLACARRPRARRG